MPGKTLACRAGARLWRAMCRLQFASSGRRYAQVLRERVMAGLRTEALGCEENSIASAIAGHDWPNCQIDIVTPDGQVIRLLERAAPDCGRLGLYNDISHDNEALAASWSSLTSRVDARWTGLLGCRALPVQMDDAADIPW